MKQKSIQERLIDEIVFSSISDIFEGGIYAEFNEEVERKISDTIQSTLRGMLSQESQAKLQEKGILY